MSALGPCEPWAGRTDKDGYGRTGDSRLAHRAAYEERFGAIEDGLHLDHLCHTLDLSCVGGISCRHRRCVNPEHLAPVMKVENDLRGRSPQALNAQKDVCQWGHPFDESNTRIELVKRTRSGGAWRWRRTCRACDRRRQAESKERKLAALSGMERAA